MVSNAKIYTNIGYEDEYVPIYRVIDCKVGNLTM